MGYGISCGMGLASTVGLTVATFAAAADLYEAERSRMVREQIQARGIKNADVLRAMQAIPRHLFVPDALRQHAYADRPLPIGRGQTISQPYVVAMMTEVLQPKASHRVLEIGTGSGYQAAVLSMLVKEVYTIEIVAELAKSADARLASLGYRNVTVRHGDGYKGWREKAPFDLVILTAAPPEIPEPLINQLAPGGKLVAPVGGSFGQELVLVEKSLDGKIRRRSIAPVMFVPMVPAA